MSKFSFGVRASIVLLFCATAAVALPAQTFTTIHNFDGTDGGIPEAGLVQSTNGRLYGTTLSGGTAGGGNVFSITANGVLTSLYDFSGMDGEQPFAGVIQSSKGKFYGTTSAGGINGEGTVFSLTPGGQLATLHNFAGADGENPHAGLTQGVNGAFYGTTAGGGANYYGSVFRISPNGILVTLHSFCASGFLCPDGQGPVGNLVLGNDGKFYGTTANGGANAAGTVFTITADGTLNTLYAFCSQSNCTDGASPLAGLIVGPGDILYGTTSAGGTTGNGTVFKITPSGHLTTVYSFCIGGFPCADGANPQAGLVLGTDGNLYGTTLYYGGPPGDGTAFSITPGGTLTTLHTFCSQMNCVDGIFPQAGLVQATNGSFYGTTSGGGTNGFGTVFSVSVGLGPFVETSPASGVVGDAVTILGTNLTGATKVTFHGIAAEFTVVSSSLITTTVPMGATTGTVKVVTPGGTLASNVPFRAQP